MTIASEWWEQGDDAACHILIFVTFQRWKLDLRLAGVGAVNGLAVVSERFLRESLWVTALLGAFRPSITVRMQRDAQDAQTHAAAFEFFGTVLFHPQGNLRQQKSSGRERAQDGFHRRTEMNKRRSSSFFAGVSNHAF